MRWDILTIGNVSRNRYWGEGDDQARLADLIVPDRDSYFLVHGP